MDIEIGEFITYLHNTKKTSANTEISYQRDLEKNGGVSEGTGNQKL